ncbi:MAG: alpha/beta hydrolase [Pacificimonas sp.]
MMKLILALAAIILAPLLLVGCAYFRSPPAALNLADSVYARGGDIEAVAEGVVYTDEGVKLDVWADMANDARDKPVIVFFYGGSWTMGERTSYRFVGKSYAERGFVVVVADYRLVPDVHFPAYIEDGAAAIAWAGQNIAQYGGDPDTIVLAGHSAGAHIAMLLGLDASWVTAAGGDPAAVKAVLGLSGPYDFYPFDNNRAIAAMGNAPDPLQTQPITFARADAPALWLATGTADTVVQPRNSRALAAKQGALGSETTVLKEYEGLSHNDVIMALSEPFRGKGPILEDSIAFLESNGIEGKTPQNN